MDAKPQRLRVRGDENAPPLQSLYHQRNKSTSALINPGERANNGPRRAFIDVTNTKEQQKRGPSHDAAMMIADKTSATNNLANDVANSEKSALSQPAQRATSMAGVKSMLNAMATKPVNPAGKALSTKAIKRNNVFRDAEHLEPVIQKEASKEFAPSVRREPAIEEQAKSKDAEKVEADSAIAPTANLNTIASTTDIESEGEDDAAAASVQHFLVTLSEPDPSMDFAAASLQSFLLTLSDPDERTIFLPSDNTTGVTTVIFPKYSASTRFEIIQAKKMVEASRTEEDELEDFYDTSMVAEYTNDIFLYMRQQEVSMLPVMDYMDNQAEIQWSMRAVLMDWLVQVHHRFNLLPETLYLCVNLIDRFLSNKIVSLGKLQLVGATALFIAAKYEEVRAPSIHDIVYMVDGGYSHDEIFKAERFMLGILRYELGWPGPMSFLRRISKADDYDLETRTLAKYFIELTIMDERFVCTPPSFAAAAAHCLALLMLRKGVWTHAHAYYSGYIYRQLYDTMLALVDCCESPQTHHQAIYEKYMDRRFKRASGFVEAEIQHDFSVPLPVADDNSGRLNGTANY